MLGRMTAGLKKRLSRNSQRGGRRTKAGANNMDWIGKVRPQVFAAIVLLGTMGIYSIYSDSFEAAAGFGALVGMLAKEVIASDD